ncbi:hypothetical protein SD70_26285 [Gordoniibacillus kamchatkensis]|uniref:Secreted protein n=1 Tax=Gordoniibacillus kamchatkensis TaxID=1590651 RepID=A0ABR5ABR2_9BACL|nr:hypothetical protein SD70_26285 [Paenibacillus sp. VKM B-2647]
MFILFALIPACFANIGANSTKLFRVGIVMRHRLRSKSTNVGALSIQPNTFFHHRKVIFIEASVVTVIACQHTFYAFINAMLKLLM